MGNSNNLSGIDLILYNKFKNLSNQQLIDRINSRFRRGLNDDDEVYEMVRRKKAQNLNIKVDYDTYTLIK